MPRLFGGVYYGWVIAVMLGITQTITWGIVYYGFSSFLPAQEAELGWSRGEMSGALSVAMLLSGLAAAPVGHWLDHHGPRLSMTLGTVAAVALLVVLSQVTSLGQFYVIWALLGLVMATVLYEPAFVVITAWFERQRTRAMMIVTLMAGLASTIFFPVAAWLIELMGWRPAMLALAAFLAVAEHVAGEMNAWARGFFGRETVADWRRQLDFTTVIFRPRGLHLDDRHVRHVSGEGFSASIVDAATYVVHNHAALTARGASLVLYLPKIQTAEEAALWHDILSALERHEGLPQSSIKAYVLVEQVEACFQLMEIRAALGRRFVGFNTGRWDYINSVADALAWDPSVVHPNIDAVTMTFGYMRCYEDRVRRAVNTPDREGRFALWQGGMEPNIPVGSETGVANGLARAVAGAEREQREGASGKWVAHWKMVHIVRPVWERVGDANQLGRSFPPLTHTAEDAAALVHLDPAPRTIRGARDLLSVGLQYGNAFGQGMQAAALKPADFFGNEDVLYLMEDMATGEIRLSILWEWLHKGATLTADDAETGAKAGDTFDRALFTRLLEEEYAKLQRAGNRDVHDDSKRTTLPIAHDIVQAYVADPVKLPWYIDLLNVNLDVMDREVARTRIRQLAESFRRDGTRVTHNLDFEAR